LEGCAGALIAKPGLVPFDSFRPLTFWAFSDRAAKAPTIAGWTPGVRTLVEGRVLPCGCLTGTYETWTGGLVTIIDARGDRCPNRAHATNVIV
jgi:hypothetical protein